MVRANRLESLRTALAALCVCSCDRAPDPDASPSDAAKRGAAPDATTIEVPPPRPRAIAAPAVDPAASAPAFVVGNDDADVWGGIEGRTVAGGPHAGGGSSRLELGVSTVRGTLDAHVIRRIVDA